MTLLANRRIKRCLALEVIAKHPQLYHKQVALSSDAITRSSVSSYHRIESGQTVRVKDVCKNCMIECGGVQYHGTQTVTGSRKICEPLVNTGKSCYIFFSMQNCIPHEKLLVTTTSSVFRKGLCPRPINRLSKTGINRYEKTYCHKELRHAQPK